MNLTKKLLTLSFSLMLLTTVGCQKDNGGGPSSEGGGSVAVEPTHCDSEALCKTYSAAVLGRMAYKDGVGYCTASNRLGTSTEASVYMDNQLVTEIAAANGSSLFLPTDTADSSAVIYPSQVGATIQRMLNTHNCFYPAQAIDDTYAQLFVDADKGYLGACTLYYRNSSKSLATILVNGNAYVVNSNNTYAPISPNDSRSMKALADISLDLGVLIDAGKCDTSTQVFSSTQKIHTQAVRINVKANAVNKIIQ